MRLTSSGPHSHRLAQAALFVLALALAAFGIAGLAGGAKADGPVTLKFDSGQINLGIFTGDQILPASDKFPSDSLPVPQPHTDITLTGTDLGGKLSFPAAANSGITFPYVNVPHPLEDLRIPITFRLQEPGLTGTYDAATGETHLSGKMDIIVITGQGKGFPVPDIVDTGVPPLGLLARCRLPGIELNLSTETQAPFTAQRFTGGFGKTGALTATWADAPATVSENGGDCFLVRAVTAGKGALWLSNGIVKPKPQPVVPDSCEFDPDLCKPAITRVKLTPKKRKVRAGKRVKLKLKVTNTGDGDAYRMNVRLKSSNKRVKLRKKMSIDVPAGKTVVRKVKVRIKRRARGKAKITVRTGGLKAKSVLKIKHKKKHRKHHRKHHKKKHHKKK